MEEVRGNSEHRSFFWKRNHLGTYTKNNAQLVESHGQLLNQTLNFTP